MYAGSCWVRLIGPPCGDVKEQGSAIYASTWRSAASSQTPRIVVAGQGGKNL